MIVANNAWCVSKSISPPQIFKSFCSNPSNLELSTQKPANFGFFFGFPSSIRSRKNLSLCCRCSNTVDNSFFANNGEKGENSCADWDWNRWCRHFTDVEQTESFTSVLKSQLKKAIREEDFEEATRLKMAISEVTLEDSVADIMSKLQVAIDEERYHDASRICKDTASGLIGWWVGYSKESDDPFGRLVRITPGVGRLVGTSYSPRQLVSASTGTPLFEIFVVKNDEGEHVKKVVYKQRVKEISAAELTAAAKATKIKSSASSTPTVDVQGSEVKPERIEEKGISVEGATEEGIKSVINFLKDKIPGLKVKVMDVNVSDKVIHEDDDNTDSEDETDNLEDIKTDEVVLQEDSDLAEDGNDLDSKLFIGGVLHNSEDVYAKDRYTRVPAEIEEMEKDSFVLHIAKGSLALENENKETKVSKMQVAAIAAQGVSELMPSEVAKAFWSADKVSPKISRNVREIVKLAVSQAQKRSRLSEYTTFNRVYPSKGSLDPFDGLYVGAFGPYGTEVVQLRRKYGRWSDVDDTSSDLEFYEYVEAVKLTGDLNVPAGEVTFRAKIGKGNRLSNRGMYPQELGVVAGFKGQGRIAEFGFKNPQWVEGELLQLSGKGMGPYVSGADLGFLYVVPEQSFLVLFNRLVLPE